MKKLALLLFFLLTLSQCIPPANQKKPPLAVKGVLDLREWDFERDGILSLDGEWEFYWGEFLEPVGSTTLTNRTTSSNEIRSMSEVQGDTKYIKVPDAWNGYIHNEKEIDGKGYATYRLKLLTNANYKPAFRLPTIASAYELYINGALTTKAGNIGKTKETYVPYQNVQVIQFPDSTLEYEILFKVSNFDHRLGGLWTKIEMGNFAMIQKKREEYLLRDFILSGSFLIMGLYHFGLYSLRKKDKSVLSFGILSLFVSLYLLFTGEFYIYNLFPFLNFEIGTKIEYITVFLGMGMCLLFFNQTFPEDCIRSLSIIMQSPSFLLVFPLILFPVRVIDYVLLFWQSTVIPGFIYLVYVLSISVSRKREGAKSYFIGFSIFGLAAVNDILAGQRIIHNDLYAPIGFFIFIFSQAFLLSARFAKAFTQVEDLSENLERKVIERTQQLNQANKAIELALQKSDKLLLNILPEEVADELKEKGLVTPVLFESTSIMFTDFKGFTQIAEGLTPQELIKELDACFTQFDKITERYNLEKLKTIGDSYMCAGGIPRVNATHAIDSCLAALEIQSFMNQMKELKQSLNVPYWELRLGIHSGPVMAGVVGEKKFAYDIWGDTVNTASRMESSGTAGKINISYATYELVKDYFDCDYRGEVDAKNKGKVKMYYLNRINRDYAKDENCLIPNERFRKRVYSN